MRRAIIKNQRVIKGFKSVSSPARVCAQEDCGNTLKLSQKKFCSRLCRNKVLSTGNGSGELLSKYNTEYAHATLEKYLSYCEENDGQTLVPTKNSYIVLNNVCLPSKEGYAEVLGVHVSTLDNWALRCIEFAKAIDRLKWEQRIFLINGGLSKRYNTGITLMMLASNHGMRMPKKEVVDTTKMIELVKLIYEGADRIEGQRRSECL